MIATPGDAASWVDAHVPLVWRRAAADGRPIREVRTFAEYEAWYPTFAAAGLVVPTWPQQYGGLGLDLATARQIEQVLAPYHLGRLNPLGLNLCAPALFAHGTDQQRVRFLPRIVDNTERWCQLFSEPGAGSDLASLATHAARRGDEWILTGQKVWTTWAHVSDWAVCLARTNPDVPKRKGITYFLVDLHAPGVDVRPLRHLTGEVDFNEVFLDGVRVPDSSRVGAEGDGWRVANATLSGERQMVSGAGSGGVDRIGGAGADALVARARRTERWDDPRVRERVIELWAEEQIRAWTNRRLRGGPYASLGKVHQGDLNQRIQLAVVDVLGAGAAAWSNEGLLPAVKGMLRSRANTIEGGTSEINKNVVGERLIGLPREPDPYDRAPWRDVPRSIRSDVNLTELLPPPGPELSVHAAGRDHSRTEIHARADQVKDGLRGVAVASGAAVGVLLPNGADCVAALFGIWDVGGVVVPLNYRGTDAELRRIVGDLDLAALVTTPDQAPRVPGRPLVVCHGDGITIQPGIPGQARHDRGVAIVSFTSGTTGIPKPVSLLHARIVEGLDQVLGTLGARPASGSAPRMPNLIPVPLSLWAGIYQVLFAFRVGAPVVLMERFDTTEFQLLVQRYRIRSTVLPPAAMVMLADDERIADLAPLKYVRSISSPLSPLQARRFRDRFGIGVLNGYGQTELGGEVVGWSAADSKAFGDSKLGSVGRPHAGVEVSTDDASGELLVRIRGRFDTWQQTGDVARIDDDGFVWIEGRVSDMVNRGGLKVHPAEVEEVVRLSPAVADVAVAGVPDRRLGEVPVAFVVEAAPVRDADLEALCREHLAPYKVPVRFERVAVLPRNEVGKVLKRALVDSRPPEADAW